MADHDLHKIIDAIVVVQREVVTPTGERAVQQFHDEPPSAPMTLPAFINLEEGVVDFETWASAGRKLSYLVAMHFCVATSTEKYGVRTRRAWVRPVLDAFGKAVKLHRNDASDVAAGVAKTFMDRVDFDPQVFGDASYITATFHLRVVVEEAFAYAP